MVEGHPQVYTTPAHPEPVEGSPRPTHPRPRLIQPEQPRQNFIVGQQPGTEIIPPPIGLHHRLIESTVGMVEPRWSHEE